MTEERCLLSFLIAQALLAIPRVGSCGWYGLKSFLSAVAIIVATAAAQPAGMAVEVLTWPARREDIEWPRHTYGRY